MSISAFDASLPLPAKGSRLVTIRPKNTPWPIQVHIACTDPRPRGHTYSKDLTTLPTVIYNPPSGIPGSLALLQPPDENTTYPGRWIYEMQDDGKVGRVCVWDRPGYGFSEVLAGADLGSVADGLWDALRDVGETGDRGWLLVGEGYGE
jgi:hypothetical protein